MKNKNSSIFVLAALVSVIVASCAQPIEKPLEEFQEVIDTGVLAAESVPSDAQVFVDNELKGKTPYTLYNIEVGAHNVLIKKDGYSDFRKTVTIIVGRTEEVSATLSPIAPASQASKPEKKPDEELVPEPPQTDKLNKINLSSFAMYHDFENKLFTGLRAEKSDLFSRRYEAYVDFVALTPAKMKITNVPLNDLNQADCINADSGVAQLYSGQTLCVITVEGNYFAVRGSWEKVPTELEFVQLS